jgi:hypothetical protein
MRYKIHIKTLQGYVLTFNVNSYSINEGYITFIDELTKKSKCFAVANSEIEVVQ